jgi:hypothetical protein
VSKIESVCAFSCQPWQRLTVSSRASRPLTRRRYCVACSMGMDNMNINITRQVRGPTVAWLGHQTISCARIKLVSIVCLFALTACAGSSAPKTSTHEVTGSLTERVAGVSAIIAKHQKPPIPILDAYFVEEQVGDGMLGPSDFRAFYRVEVAPQDVGQWTKILTPISGEADYAAPTHPRDWWISRDAFGSLQFYNPVTLTGRDHGWIGVSQQTGRIYIFTFTM